MGLLFKKFFITQLTEIKPSLMVNTASRTPLDFPVAYDERTKCHVRKTRHCCGFRSVMMMVFFIKLQRNSH